MTKETNTGSENSGDWNSGDWNSGHRNSGDRNSGDWNSGYRNSGYRNSGDRNSGDWNSGYQNSGCFCTDTPPVRMFNKDTDVSCGDIDFPSFFYFDLTKWIAANDMTDEEKTEHPLYETTKGYLKTFGYQEAWKNAWDNTDEGDRNKVYALPNFDADIFLEITGIDVGKTDEAVIEIGGKNYRVSDIETALKVIEPVN